MPQFMKDNGRIAVQIVSTSGGINERSMPWLLREDQVQANVGWNNEIVGRRKKNFGVTSYIPLPSKPRGSHVITDLLFRQKAVMVNANNGIYSIFSSGKESTFYTHVSLSDDVDLKWCSAFGPNLSENIGDIYRDTYCIHQAYHSPTGYTLGQDMVLAQFDTVGLTLWGYTVPPIRPIAADSLDGHLWIGNVIYQDGICTGWSGSGSDLWYSDLFKPATYTHLPLSIDPGQSGEIVAVKALRSENPALIIFKEFGIYIFYPLWGTGDFLGSEADEIDTGQSKVIPLTTSIGCAAQRTIKEVPLSNGTDIWFLASDGHLRALSRVETDVEAGSGIAITYQYPKLVARINRPVLFKAHAEVNDNKYYLSLPLDGASECSHLLIFDTLTKALLAVESISLAAMCVMPNLTYFWQDKSKDLLFGACLTEATDTSATYGGGAGDFQGYHVYHLFDEDSYRNPDDSTIAAEEVSGAFTFGALGHQKAFDKFTIMLEACTAYTSAIEVQYAVAPDDFTHLATLTFPKHVSGQRYYKKSASLIDVAPDYMIQFKVKCDDYSRPAIIYTECEGRILPEEMDNSVT